MRNLFKNQRNFQRNITFVPPQLNKFGKLEKGTIGTIVYIGGFVSSTPYLLKHQYQYHKNKGCDENENFKHFAISNLIWPISVPYIMHRNEKKD